MKSSRKDLLFCFTALACAMIVSNLSAETLYVDSRIGRDTNPGTKEKPLKTIGQAATIANSGTEPGPTTIKIGPGIYNLNKCVVFENRRPYTETNRLMIEASILPDDPQWKPTLMPVILSTEDPRKPDKLDAPTGTYGLQIKNSHVTICGLKFLGNPLLNNWYNPVSRIGTNLEDFVVTQCMFVGDRDGLDIYCPVIATGDRFIVDHCVFYNSHASAVFWDGLENILGIGCKMRYCIVDGGYISGVWTCQTAEDFEFHHNIVTGCEYFWMHKRTEDIRRYRLHDCIVTGNKCYSEYGTESGPTGRTGPEVTYDEKNVIKSGKVILEKNKKSRNYLHVTPGTFGSELGAGLFINQKEKKAL